MSGGDRGEAAAELARLEAGLMRDPDAGGMTVDTMWTRILGTWRISSSRSARSRASGWPPWTGRDAHDDWWKRFAP